MSSFYVGKLNYGHIKHLYEQLSTRPRLNFLIHCKALDIADDEEYVEKLVNFFDALEHEIKTKSLKIEMEFFTRKGYKGVNFMPDLRAYLRWSPKSKSILTVLDNEDFLGSNFLRLCVNRCFFYPLKEEPELMTRDEIMLEIDSILLSLNIPATIDEEIKELQREFAYKKSIVNLVIGRKLKENGAIKLDAQNLKNELESSISSIDNNLHSAIMELETTMRDEFASSRTGIIEFILQFKLQQEEDAIRLKRMQQEFANELQVITKTVKSLTPMPINQSTELMSKLRYINEILVNHEVTHETYNKAYSEFLQVLDNLEIASNKFKIPTDANLKIQSAMSSLRRIEAELDEKTLKYLEVMKLVNEDISDNALEIKRKMIEMNTKLSTNVNQLRTTAKFIDEVEM